MNSVQAQANNASVNTLVSDSYLDALINSLQDPIESACYLNAIIEAEEPEPELLPLALNDVSKALDKTGASTHALEVIFQKQGAEAIRSLADWLKGLGLKLTVTVDAAEARSEDLDQDLEELEIAA